MNALHDCYDLIFAPIAPASHIISDVDAGKEVPGTVMRSRESVARDCGEEDRIAALLWRRIGAADIECPGISLCQNTPGDRNAMFQVKNHLLQTEQ